MPQECSCKYCGKKFKAQRYLETHINKGKECRTLRGVLFLCLRCSCFHTTKFGELENHLLSCKEDGRIFDTLESYNSKITELQCKIRYLEETKSNDNSNENKSDNFKDILDKTFGKLQTDDINNYFNSQYMEIINMKNFIRVLKKIKKQRRAIFKKGDIVVYKYLIKINLETLVKILTTKKNTNSTSPLYWLMSYIFRAYRGLLKTNVVTKGPLLIYSSSDLIPDSLPAFFLKYRMNYFN